MPRPSPTALLRGVLSLLLLATAVIGLPLLLAWATPTVWQASSGDLSHLLDRQDSGGAFLLVLLLLAWSGWAHFTLGVLVELPAQLRGRTARRRRGLGVSQRAAATLVGSILVLLPTGTALASPTTDIPAPAAAGPQPAALTAPNTPQAHAPTATAQRHTNAEDEQYRLYTVRQTRPAESLWSIAEHEMGNGELWHRIATLNDGRTMNDGTTFRADGLLQPGWTLRLPPAPTTATPHTATTSPSAGSLRRTVTVHPGDNLSSIARRELGDATAWPKIYDLNQGQPQPDGHHFTDPNLIYTGQELTLPTPPGDAQPNQPNGHDRPATTPPQATPRPPTEPAHPHSQAPSSPPHHTPSPPASPKTAPHTTAPTQTNINMRQIGGIGALLAAGLISTLAVKRILQQRRRKPGETIAVPDEPSRLEQVLTTTAEPASVDLLDTALRTMAHHAAGAGRPLPALRGARIRAHTVDLLPDHPTATPCTPFTDDSNGWWTLTDRNSLLPTEEARRIPAPYPGLVTIGTDTDGSHLLLNLPHIRALLLDGPVDKVREVARAITAEAATSVWSDHADILTIGVGNDADPLLPQGRLRTVSDVHAALRDLGELLLEAYQNPTATDAEDPLPWMLICAAETTADDAWELADALAKARELPVTLVLPAEQAAACFPDAERLDAAWEDHQPCSALETPVALQRLTDDAFGQFLNAVRTAEQPPTPTDGAWAEVPEAPGAALGDDGQKPPQNRPTTDEQGSVAAFAQQTSPFLALTTAVGATHSVQVIPAPSPAASNSADESGHPAPAIPPGKPDPTQPSAPPEHAAPADTAAPEIQVLGPVTVTGIESSGHGPKLASLAALIYFKPGRSADELCNAMDPASPWSRNTLQVRISELRKRLGTDADGNPYLPRDRNTGYRLSASVRCDWDQFQQLTESGLRKGPTTGIADLEAALALVRGRPLSGGTHAWATCQVQQIISRITDTAHTVATWHREAPRPDLDAARRAIATGLDADDTAELLYQDWITVEHQAGNRAGVFHAIDALQAVNRRLDVDMLPQTEELITSILEKPKQATAI